MNKFDKIRIPRLDKLDRILKNILLKEEKILMIFQKIHSTLENIINPEIIEKLLHMVFHQIFKIINLLINNIRIIVFTILLQIVSILNVVILIIQLVFSIIQLIHETLFKILLIFLLFLQALEIFI